MSPTTEPHSSGSGRHAAPNTTKLPVPAADFDERVAPWRNRNVVICVIVTTILALVLLNCGDILVAIIGELFGGLASLTPASPISIGSTIGRIVAVLLCVLLLTKLFRLTLPDLGMVRENRFGTWLTGAGFGFAAVTVVYLLNVIFGALDVSFTLKASELWVLLLAAVFFAFQGFFEELLFRFFIIPAYAARITVAGAIGLSSILFAFIHINNPNLTVFGMVNLVLYGVVFGTMYWRTGNAWFVAGWHSGWNFVLSMLYGSHVSGNALPGSVLSSAPSGSELLNGGEFGLEGSVLSTLLGIAIIAWCVKTKPASDTGLFTRRTRSVSTERRVN
ncbi:CPBP family intramembrane glutamic endopeptidase [Corynebacterium pygosceleis]|uniref:CPBP family intramembrane metalloprotease n=1 Tax=Corynebacterium pygosceleis TaxID=2800406 RepID=A0A9Q4C7J3_9CORY|nr:CPBP family intramembrane glutamic endopeptidase [Corynebacterium pygosceleis]MCK7637749.1 CPBP family intramembrane metalloprotease [Corynebacterium pygosceleis]MCK7674940.1 CPBP family intramembrane metalloprotease [Corynebacterium pygosceleis]MCL0119471.1 CPBP family intramembrane metalloprotease [Corynebacterium pygosceleis]MCX7444711.1 CPBP family intramembrane metalloprotease [Corynebacterium pygosceleis]MCX7467922.1 CPBP family intramembrane metalloprotease [Corynebacterium pygoscele